MGNYIKPQVQTFQDYIAAPTATTSSLNAFVVGPHFDLHRYGEANEATNVGAYDGTESTYTWPQKATNSVVDQSFTKLFCDGVMLSYFEVVGDAANPVVCVDQIGRNRLRATPRIVDGDAVLGHVCDIEFGGFYSKAVIQPDTYYFAPKADFVLGTDAGKFTYRSVSGVTGEIDVGVNAVTAGVLTPGPNGLQLDFDTAGSLKAPRAWKLTDDEGGYITIGADLSLIGDYMTNVAKLSVSSGAVGATFSANTLAITFTAGDSLNDIAAAISGATGYDAAFKVSDVINGTGLGTAVALSDSGVAVTLPLSNAVAVPELHSVTVLPNDLVFAGPGRSAQIPKDVEAGDYLTYTVTPDSTGVPVTSTVRVIRTESAMLPAVTAAGAFNNPSGRLNTSGDDLSATPAIDIEAGSDNQRLFDGVNTGVQPLSSALKYVDASQATAVLGHSFTITITKTGAKGVALCDVVSDEGAVRTAVKIEDAGTDDGQIYLGYNVVLNLDKAAGDADAIFQKGDVFQVGPIRAPVGQPALSFSGEYTGVVNTTYAIEVIRGGVFSRTTDSSKGLKANATVALAGSLAAWRGGDIDDEYILTVTSPGAIATARFSLTSRSGDNVDNLTFSAFGTGGKRSVGIRGLQLQLNGSGSFVAGEYWVLQVKAARPLLAITDSAGSDRTTQVVATVDEVISVGLRGVKATFAANNSNGGYANTNGGLVKGDRWTIVATAQAAGPVQTIVLSDKLPAAAVAGLSSANVTSRVQDTFDITLSVRRSGVEIPRENRDPNATPGSYNWTQTANGFTVAAGLTLQHPDVVDSLGSMPFMVVSTAPDLHAHYRSLRNDFVNTVYTLESLGDIVGDLGAITVDNPLALGLSCARKNSAHAVHFIAVASNDADGYALALKKAELTSKVHDVVVLSADDAVISVAKDHIRSMAKASAKKWRMGYFGSHVKADFAPVIGLATVSADLRAGSNVYTRVEFTEDTNMTTKVKIGDTVRLKYAIDSWGGETFVTGKVVEIENDLVCYLEASLSSVVTIPSRTEIWHRRDSTELALTVKAESTSYLHRDMVNVFPDVATLDDGATVPSYYLAAAVAGLRASSVPHQGLTNSEIVGFSDLRRIYSDFSAEDLDTIASGGTCVIAQDEPNGSVYVRHQLTTAYTTGILEQSEISMVANANSISYYLTDLVSPLIGRYNITPELLMEIEASLASGVDYLGTYTKVGLLGPQLILANTVVKSVVQHPTARDRAIGYVTIGLPAPFNNLDLHLEF